MLLEALNILEQFDLKSMKRNKIALIGDTTGYGTVSVRTATEDLSKKGLKPVYTVLIDPNKTDLSDEIAKARAAGADVIMPWSAATGVLARLINARGDAGWDVPVIGHPSLMALPLKELLNKPSYWEKVYGSGYVATSYDANGNQVGGVKIKWSTQSSDPQRRVRLFLHGELEALMPGLFTVTAEAAGVSARPHEQGE